MSDNGFVMRKDSEGMKKLLGEIAPADTYGSQPQAGQVVGKMF
jgi:hypothetical protein